MTKKAVCVCSGGIDSTVAATIALLDGYEVHFFHASYGQRAEAREKEVVEKIAQYLDAKELMLVDIAFLKELGGSALTDLKRTVPVGEEVNLDLDTETPSTWVPCRNLILLAHASAYAEVIGAEALFVGFNAEEARSYPDNDVEFVNRYNEVLEKAVASFSQPPVVKAPLVNLLKPEIIKKGMEVKAPLHLTYSCYLGGEKHCGICESCLHRKRGFKDAGVEDPTEYMC
jgi:7-cyano-7-deazaguanine synthase